MIGENKKEFGQFFTDSQIAQFMAKLVNHPNLQSVLDPAVGMGSLINQIYQMNQNAEITGCEIDPAMAEQFQKNCSYDVDLLQEDYLQVFFSEPFSAIICNPPYHRFQEISNRKELIAAFEKRYQMKMSGYSNSCVYFLIKSMHELALGGKCCYIMPYEFLNTGYGEVIKQALLESGMLKMILRFDSQLTVFDDAITTACIILLENCPHKEVLFGTITSIEQITSAELSDLKLHVYSYQLLDPKKKWLPYFDVQQKIQETHKCCLGDYVKISRGIATGANEYFLLNEEQLVQNGIRKECCLPCIPKAKMIKGALLTENVFLQLARDGKNVFLFDASKAKLDSEKAYIELGEKRGVHKRYLTSHRHPWHMIEDRKPAPILMCVFNRDGIKVVRNKMEIRTLTAFHGVYPKEGTKLDMDLLFGYLLTATAQNLLLQNRREYANGLDKFEPSDLMQARCIDFEKIADKDVMAVRQICDRMKEDVSPNDVQKLNAIFERYMNA